MKATDQKFRSSLGALENPTLSGRSEARIHFLNVVRALYPNVFEEPRQHSTALDEPPTSPFWLAWKREHRLVDDWTYSAVRYELRIDRDHPGLTEQLRAGNIPRVGVRPTGLEDALFENGGPGPLSALPTEETKQEFLSRCARHYDAVEAALKRSGMARTRLRPKRHFEWLAQHTAGRLPIADISREYNPAPGAEGYGTVSKAIHTLGQFLELTLPSRQSGK